jgi:hypothetical protein
MISEEARALIMQHEEVPLGTRLGTCSGLSVIHEALWADYKRVLKPCIVAIEAARLDPYPSLDPETRKSVSGSISSFGTTLGLLRDCVLNLEATTGLHGATVDLQNAIDEHTKLIGEMMAFIDALPSC